MRFIRLTLVCVALSLLPSATASASPQATSNPISSAQNAKTGEIVEPLPIRLINPVYPTKVRKKRMHGQIVLSVTIANDGTVKAASVVNGNPLVVDAALEAVRRWLYLPAMRNGKFVEMTQEVTIDYDFGKNASPPDEHEPGSLSEPPQNLLQDIAAGKLFRVGPGVTSLRALSAPDPQYTEEARRDKFRGRVLLCVVVGADGRPRDVWVARPLGHGLDTSAVETVKNWEFSPALKDGVPVAAVVGIEASFDIY
jgi:TonB family protein